MQSFNIFSLLLGTKEKAFKKRASVNRFAHGKKLSLQRCKAKIPEAAATTDVDKGGRGHRKRIETAKLRESRSQCRKCKILSDEDSSDNDVSSGTSELEEPKKKQKKEVPLPAAPDSSEDNVEPELENGGIPESSVKNVQSNLNSRESGDEMVKNFYIFWQTCISNVFPYSHNICLPKMCLEAHKWKLTSSWRL